jgi:voltage-gated potassium channel
MFSFAARFLHSTRILLDSRGMKYVLLSGGLLFAASAALVLLFEENEGGNITNYGEALWWAATTVTTVGYGDFFPISNEGKAIAVFLMFLGISLFSYVTANVAAFFVRPAEQRGRVTLEDVMERLDRLERQLTAQPEPSADGTLEERTPVRARD